MNKLQLPFSYFTQFSEYTRFSKQKGYDNQVHYIESHMYMLFELFRSAKISSNADFKIQSYDSNIELILILGQL